MHAAPLFFSSLIALAGSHAAADGLESEVEVDIAASSWAARQLSVCTTGDYPPVTSYDPSTGEYTGLAPTILDNFARNHNYSVVFVRSSWASLVEDLARGSTCLLAAGGITDRPSRTANFGVSVPILANRKVPVFSKENANRFLKFSDFDNPDVVLLENVGTDEVFAETLRSRGLLQKPSVKTVSSVEEAYACIRHYSQLPLVMFADQIEVDFHAALPDAGLSIAGEAIELPSRVGSDGYQVFLANNSTEAMVALLQLNRYLTGARAIGLFDAWEHAANTASYEVPHADCPLQLSLI